MVTLKKVTRSNPQDAQAPDKYYLHAVKTGFTDLKRLAYLISNQSTVRRPDCLAVLDALIHNMTDELAQGRVVQLGDLGNFQVEIRSMGADTEEEALITNMKSAHLNYRPSKELKNALKVMDYHLIEG